LNPLIFKGGFDLLRPERRAARRSFDHESLVGMSAGFFL
jgi:hypothetical protein